MNWKGGKYLDKDGYVMILRKDHPFPNARGYVKEHRLIFEHYLKIMFDDDVFIPKNIEIHHKNGNKSDNRLINLSSFTKAEHTSLHMVGNIHAIGNKKVDYTNVLCYFCNEKTYVNSNGKEVWYKYKNDYICRKCYRRLN